MLGLIFWGNIVGQGPMGVDVTTKGELFSTILFFGMWSIPPFYICLFSQYNMCYRRRNELSRMVRILDFLLLKF